MLCLDLPERRELSEIPPKDQKDKRIYSWTVLCKRDQTNLRFTRAFTAAIKAQASLRLPHAPPNSQRYFLRRPKGRRSNIALDLQFMQIFTNQKYS